MRRRYYDFAELKGGRTLQALARDEFGGTPTQDPRAYVDRSPDHYVRQLAFSHVPLQMATVLGFVISAFAFALVPVIIVLRIVGSYLPGFGTLTIAILLLGGVQLITLLVSIEAPAGGFTRE